MIKITMKIDGMMCSMCEGHVNEVFRKALNIKKVTSSHRKNETIIISEEDISEDKLREAIETTGYRIESICKEEYEKKGLFGFKR